MYVFLTVLCALFALVLLLLFLPVRLIVSAGESVTLELKLLFIRIKRYPEKRRRPSLRQYSAKRMEREEKKTQKKTKKKAPAPSVKKTQNAPKKRTVMQKLRRVRAICTVLIRHTRKHLRLHTARLHVRVATGDAATTAIAFGAVSQSVSYLLAALDQVTDLKAPPTHISVEPDFLAERSSLDVKLILQARVWAILGAALSLLLSKMNLKRVQKARRTHKKSSTQKGI
ncbi:MAG: DUF2953 domain-containing protein [Ruminococcaceae bacterium]|nr:DUF2953 domain-containing protein [Oscillospiraceae bacterium]